MTWAMVVGSLVSAGLLPLLGRLLPVAVAADVFGNAVGFKHDHARHHVVEKLTVVADDQHRASKRCQPLLEQLQRFQVEIVGRLVEHKQVGWLREQLGEQQPVAFTAGEHLHWQTQPVGREEEVLQEADHMPLLAVDLHEVAAFVDLIEDRPLGIELVAELIEKRDFQIGAGANRALLRRELPQQELEQRGLARAVGAHDAHPVAAENRRGKVGHDIAAVVGKGDLLGLADERAAAAGLLDGDLGLALHAPPLAPLLPHRLERPHAAFVAGAAGLNPLADPGLLLGELLVEERILLVFSLEQLGLPHKKGVVVARPVVEPAAVELPDAVGEPPQEAAVVGDKEQCAPPAGEKLLQPGDRLEVEVVGRLVEQQHVGLGD